MSLMGIDLGTTVCKAAVFADDGSCYGVTRAEYELYSPAAGRFELGADVWEQVKTVIRSAVQLAGNDPVTALSVSSMGEAMVPLADRRIVGNTILGHDERGVEYVGRLTETYTPEAFYAINPNVRSINYAMPKLKWVQEHDRALFAQTDCFLGWADAILYLLGADPACCNTLANRTLLFDLDANDWSQELLDAVDFPRDKLAPVVPGGAIVGTVSTRMADELGLSMQAQLVAGSHDQCCNALGAGGIEGGQAVCGIGTYECITPVFAGVPDKRQMLAAGLNIEHHVLKDRYVAFIYNQAGMLTDWFRQLHQSDFGALEAGMPEGPTTLLTLPYFEPSGAPDFIADGAGAVLGLRSTTTRGELYKSLLEGISFFFVESLRQLDAMDARPQRMVATGGGARSDKLLQLQADIFGSPITRARTEEAGAAGAAMLAGLSTGIFATGAEACEAFVSLGETFEPDLDLRTAYMERYEAYRRVLPGALDLIRSAKND